MQSQFLGYGIAIHALGKIKQVCRCRVGIFQIAFAKILPVGNRNQFHAIAQLPFNLSGKTIMVTFKKTNLVHSDFIITVIWLGEAKTVSGTGHNRETRTKKSRTKGILLSNCAFMRQSVPG